MSTARRVIGALSASFMLALALALPAAAASTDTGVVRSYASDLSVRQGMIVALSGKDANTVEPLTTRNISDMLGVAVSPTDAPITVTGDASTQAYVATSGQYKVLVSTENGIIHAGDYISISSLNGIGMKATDTEAVILGRAAADLTASAIIQSKVDVATARGKESVAIGAVQVTINIANNPNAGHGTGNLPGFLQIVSENIADKPVAAPRVYAALAILLVAGLTAAAILYSGIRGGISAIGRNPLARHSIFGAILQSVGAGLAVFILGLVGVYLLLKL